jgi:hypothetical protein
MLNFQKLSDAELYSICKKWGAEVLEARRKFAGLLPEVYRREMAAQQKGGSWFRKRKFVCVYDFAGRLAGMSRKQVDQVLRLDKRFEDKPVLREALVSGAISANKLARVVSIATVENQSELLEKVEMLSKAALDIFVKEYARENSDGLDKPQTALISDGFGKPQNGQNGLPGQTQNAISGLAEGILKTGGGEQAVPGKLPVILDEDVAKELLEMQSKNIDVNSLLREFLRNLKDKHEREKQQVAAKQERERDERALIGYPAKRYIPTEVKRILAEEFGDRCSAPGCGKPAENLHHEKGFMKDQCHDPRYLKPLCKGHHELVHYG